MKLNGIDCNWYDVTGKDTVEFGLETDFAGALALDGERLTVTHDDGETQVAVYDGYALAGIVSDSDGGVRASFARELPDATAQAIRGAEESARTALAQSADAAAGNLATALAVAELGAAADGIKAAGDDTALATGELGAKVAELEQRLAALETVKE